MNHFSSIIGQAPVFESLLRSAKVVASTDVTVLIKGDTGTGKEVLATAIQKYSARADQAFITLNCAALPESLVESELFGHRKGAFTGANNHKPGLFQSVDGGTLFLDEINSLPLTIQSKLLRFLETGECLAIGDTKPYYVNVRIIAATNTDLQQLIQAGQFRQDLYFRLNVVPLELPLLRQRPEDIDLLTKHFMQRFAKDYAITPATFSKSALKVLRTYAWPGNIRELRNLCERLSILLSGRLIELDNLPPAPVKIMMNVGNPDRAFDFASIPHRGVGLARLEFIVNRMIGVHPRALLDYDRLRPDLKEVIREQMAGEDDPVEFFVGRLAEGIACIAAAFAPEPVIVRLSDFKTNEYANLIGGQQYEPEEENPMLGFRGASRYVAPSFRPCFDLECRALKRVREEMGLSNVEVMVPFVRTLGEATAVCQLLAENGLKRGENGLRLIMMCELPTNALLAREYLQHFDGMSIGSNDMTQLTLGLDRDSGLIAHLFDERDPAVKALLSMAISACREQGKYIGICGQGPSDHPDFARWLVDQGIDSVSLNPDTVVETWLFLAGVSAG